VESPKWLKSLAPAQPAPVPSDGDQEPAEKLERDYTVEVDDRRFTVKVIGPPPPAGAPAGGNSAAPRPVSRRARSAAGAGSADGASETLLSPLQGTVLKVSVEQGQEIESGAVVCVIEAMKMENEITAHRSGKVEELKVAEGGSIASGDTIAVIR
jgi:acetyl-CoA/propionyl-CoA carboxylase biotin carboxyl carrier protein